MGTSPETSAERSFRFWNDPGRRSRDSNSSAARSGIRAALVFEICPLSRNAAFDCAGRTLAERPAARAHRRIQSSGARVSQLSSRPTLGRTKSRAIPALTPTAFGVETVSAFLGRRRRRTHFRRRGSRCYVLLDEIPEG